ncbi:MAG: hypothetical protein PHC62_06540 [Candidatus Izemoplasmatales bacterium]|nr:hypothetical protein [Candidatus Izemoplasmatales bacterium]
MNDRDAKRYFKKINTTFVGVNKQDEFAKMFINILKSGNTTLYQKERRERRIFDDSWMTAVEEAVPVIDKLTRHPRENLKKTSSVVPVERAKRVDKDTIRHLASNTQLIRSMDRDGNVMPSHVLTSYSDSDLGTYENRFLRSLVDNLYLFIEKRYDLIVKKMHTEYVNFLNVKSELEWNNATIDYDITLKINQNMDEDEVDKKNQDLLNRITELRTSIINFKMSKFMQDMKEFAEVRPPIMQTNIMLKNKDFRRCFELWIVLEQVDRIGYDVDVFERDVNFDEEYLSHIENALMMLYVTVADSQTDDFTLTQNEPFEYRKIKKPKITKQNDQDLYIDPGYDQLENYQLSQYYLDQIRKSNYSRFKTLDEAGISVHESIEIVFKQVNEISNAVYEDYIKSTFKIEDKKILEEKVKVQQDIIEVYKQVEQIKRDDLRALSTNKAIAFLNLRNLKDEIKKRAELEKLEKQRQKEQERLEKVALLKEKEEERLAKQRKIKAAKKVLEDAKLLKKERALKEKAKKAKKAANDKKKNQTKAKSIKR